MKNKLNVPNISVAMVTSTHGYQGEKIATHTCIALELVAFRAKRLRVVKDLKRVVVHGETVECGRLGDGVAALVSNRDESWRWLGARWERLPLTLVLAGMVTDPLVCKTPVYGEIEAVVATIKN